MRKINTKRLDKKLKGYHKHFRGRFLLLRDLTPEEYVLWDISFSLAADWDKNHDSYGTFSFTFSEISYFTQCSPSTISRKAKKLFTLGLWKKLDDGSIEVSGFNVLEHLAILTKELGVIDLQTYIADQQTSHATKNNQVAKLHDDSSKEIDTFSLQTDANLHTDVTKESLISSKDGFSVPIKKVIIKNKVKSIEEYQKIYQENGNQGLTPQDMKDADESIGDIYEEVTPDNEQFIVDVFFNGDWDDYRKNTFIDRKKGEGKSGL
jgi:hypothetical protein